MAKRSLRIVALLLLCALTGRGQVVINEIMFHPSSENVLEEYIELHNRAATNVNLAGWRFSNGIDFTFAPGTILPANGYLVVAAHRQTFTNKYPGVLNVVGNWVGILSNSRNDLDLDDASGARIDSVEYADEGDWAVRQRGPLEGTHRGWVWFKEPDGLGKSLELVNPALPNEHGQNWRASITPQGTPGVANSVLSANVPPMILEARHFPPVPSPTDNVIVTARLLNETASNVTALLHWRVASATPDPLFQFEVMLDDGLNQDGAANDGIFGAVLPPHLNNTVIEFYIEAFDAENNIRTWPAAALDENGNPGQFANALYQVDDNPFNIYGGTASQQPVYKMIMTEIERAELAVIPSQSNLQGPNSQMNGAFISLDASGVSVHYLVGIRNRGHASRQANPPNYRVNFRSDDLWQGVTGINLNSQQVHIQHFGSTLANKSGSAGSYSRPVQLRVNNANRANSGSPMFGSYAANEVYDSQWAERHFPNDSGGNIYKAVRDLKPPDFDYRTLAAYPSGNYGSGSYTNYGPDDGRTYKNTWAKETNVSEDDWTDMTDMLRVMGINGTEEYSEAAVRGVINVEQWLTHLAVMSLMGNHESGLNDGHNDDYYMYAGAIDRRFIFMHHDLDQILGFGGSHPPTDQIFGCTTHPPSLRGSADNSGVGLMMQRFLSTNFVFRTQYLQTLQRLLDTTFSQAQFDALVDQTLGTYVPPNTRNSLKNWMNQRRAHVLTLIAGNPAPGFATITGEPRSPTPSRSASLTIGGNDITHYRFRLNNGSYGAERAVTQPAVINNLPLNSINTVYVIGKTAAGGWQSLATPTASRTWIVNTAWPAVRINEVLARNTATLNHEGTFPDYIELHNEGTASVDLSGMRLTDDPADPNKFTFPPNTTLAAGAYLPLYANNPDGTSGIHLGFGLNDTGDGVYLYHRVANGGALLDSVQFGLQLPDLSIGRTNGVNSGTWFLCQPTHVAANVAIPVGDTRTLRLNEILTSPRSPFVDDFIEIFNPASTPVNLGGLYLTDTPIGAPNQHRIPDLTFLPAGSYFVFTADGETNQFDHVNFQLSSDLGEVALIGPGNQTIDCIIYGPQRPGISYGRCPDASAAFNFLVLPTPGSPNACPTPPETGQVTLIPYNHVWRFVDAGTNLGTIWRNVSYDDSLWPAGPGLLGLDNDPQPEPIRTPFIPPITGKITFYFRTTFVVPPGLNPSQLTLSHLIDDGAVFYLNGQEVGTRFNMPPGEPGYLTSASGTVGLSTSEQSFQLPINVLQPGTNHFAVEVHQAGGNSPDVVFGLRLQAIVVTNSPGGSGLRINEVLANNGTIAEPDGSTPDWVEFYNPADFPVDLAGMSVSDSTLNPDRFVFPSGSLVPARGYFALRFDADRLPSATNTGFGLRASGDSLYLFAPANTIFDSVSFGFQAADFSIIRTDASSWTLGLPTIGATNFPVVLGDLSQLRINEWMANPRPGDDDWFEVYNPNLQPVSLGGCYLTDDLNDRTKYFPIPALSFIGAITNAWQKLVADGNTQNGADHVGFNLRGSGEAIGLSTTNGFLIDGINFGSQTEGVSQGRLLDGEANIVSFLGTPSPGDPNYVLMNGVVINEILTHTDLPLEDAIEIRNISASPVNVSGWWLSDSRGAPRKYQIPLNTPALPAGGFRVFYEYQLNDPDVARIPFSLSSANGDEVYLSSATNSGILNGARAQAEFGAAENGVSFGRYVTSVGAVDFPAMRSLSLGTSVTRESPTNQIGIFRTGQGAANPYPKTGPLVISELMYRPDLSTNDNTIEEFVEIHNPTAAAVPLYDPAAPTNRWRLRDGVDFDFPPNTSVPPGAYLLVVSFDPTNNPSALSTFRARYGSNSALVGPYSGKLANDGEGIKLLKPDTAQPNGSVPFVLVDYVAYLDRAPWPTNADGFGASLQRRHALGYGNDVTNWLAAVPTPGPSGDFDNDGLPDDWELRYASNLGVLTGSGDNDSDGMTNLQEYAAGTHPRNAASVLEWLSINRSGNTVTVLFNAVSNKTYSVETRDSLSTNWGPFTNFPPSPIDTTRTVTDSLLTPERYYRLLTP